MTQQLSLCHTEGPSDALNYAIIGSDNGLSPDRRQAIIWTNAKILLIHFKKMRLKMSSGKRRPFCLGLDVLTHPYDRADEAYSNG